MNKPERQASGADMNNLKLALMFSALILAVGSGKSRAAFDEASQSVTAEAMGGAFAAKADDSSALFINPAGLNQLERGEFSLMYGKPMAAAKGMDLGKNYAVMAMPLNNKVSIACGGSLFDASGLMKEYEGILGAAVRLTPRISVGGSLSYLSHSYAIDGEQDGADPVFAGGKSRGALGLDLGMQAGLTDKLSMGLSGRHLNRPNVGLIAKDAVPMELRGGLVYRMEKVSVLADVTKRDAGPDVSQAGSVRLGGGVEWKAMDRLALRSGLNNTALTAGFGITLKSLRLDYAFDLAYQAMEDNGGSHKLAVSVGFGNKPEARRQSVSPRQRVSGSDSFWIY